MVNGDGFVKENKLTEHSMKFSVDNINLVKHLKSSHESVISNQIGRSGTAIGANIFEAKYAPGKKILFLNLKSLSSKCTSLRVMLIASCKTDKETAK